jgi:hypothetical protein
MFADSVSIIPYPEATVVVVEHILTRKTRFVCPQKLCKKPHSLRVDVAICKIACVEDESLETDVPSGSSCIDAVDRHEVLRGPSVRVVGILIRYRVSFSTALVQQLQLWHFHWLVSIQSMSDLRSQVP